MKNFLVITLFLLTFTAEGQLAKSHFLTGYELHTNKDYTGAIKEYSLAIKENSKNYEAYFNRGNCQLQLKNYSDATADFNKTIEINPRYVKAYYSRATVNVILKKYSDALPDLDKTIELDSKTPNALTLRGQIRAQTGNKEGGCNDLQQAKKNGDVQADKYILQFCGADKESRESISLKWPEAEGWKVGDDQENDQQRVVDMIRNNETVNNWTELGNMTTIKGVKGVPMDKAMNLMYDQSLKNSPKAKLTLLEKNETAEYPWIIFTIEAAEFKNESKPESQLWFIVQGKQALYTNFFAVKKSTLTAEEKTKWTAFFKTGRIINK